MRKLHAECICPTVKIGSGTVKKRIRIGYTRPHKRRAAGMDGGKEKPAAPEHEAMASYPEVATSKQKGGGVRRDEKAPTA